MSSGASLDNPANDGTVPGAPASKGLPADSEGARDDADRPDDELSAEMAHPARRLHRKAWMAFVLLAVLVVLQQVLVEPRLAELTSDAPVINVAGRQRMLSQRLVKSALALERSTTAADVSLWRANVSAVLLEWRTAHRGLRGGDAAMRLPPTTEPSLVAAFDALDPHFEEMAAAAEDLILLSQTPPGLAWPPGVHSAVARLLLHEAEFLPRMHALVGLYEAEARGHVSELQMTGWLLASGVVLVALAAQLGVLQPAIALLGRRMEQSERQYRLLVDSMSDGLVLLDARGRIRFANPRFRELIGLSNDVSLSSATFANSASRRGERFFTDCVDPADRAVWLDILGEAEPTIRQTELRLCRTDGKTLSTLVSARRFPRETGYNSALLLVIGDISARRTDENRMRGLQEQLSHATRLKSMGEMAATLAHEINQPLGAIANYSEGCLQQIHAAGPESALAAELRGPLERMLRAALRGGEIIRRARRFVSPGAREAALEDVNALLTDVQQLCLPEARHHGILLDLDLARDLPTLFVDGIQLQQVVTNLVQNSLQAIREGGLLRTGFDTGHITLRTRSHGADAIRIEIEDDGPGIPPETAARVFDPFFTTRAEGTGMGLAIVKNIVEAHGGQVVLIPRGSQGTLFRIDLPIRTPSEASYGHAGLPPVAVTEDSIVVRDGLPASLISTAVD
jgi:signal transduction histidine kinase